MGATCGVITDHSSEAPEFTPGFSGVRVAQSFLFCVMFCRSLFVPLYFFFWPLYCLSFDLRLLLTPLASSNFSLYNTYLYLNSYMKVISLLVTVMRIHNILRQVSNIFESLPCRRIVYLTTGPMRGTYYLDET